MNDAEDTLGGLETCRSKTRAEFRRPRCRYLFAIIVITDVTTFGVPSARARSPGLPECVYDRLCGTSPTGRDK